MAEQAPEHQDRGLFGKKEEKEGKPPANHTHNEAQTEAAPQHGVEHCQGHSHEGQLTPEEAEQQKHTKLHRTHSSSSSSSSDEEEEGKKKKEGERKKKGVKDKIKDKLHGDGQHSSNQCGVEEKKKVGMLDKIKERLPGQHSSDESGREEEKKVGLLDKIKEKLPGHRNNMNKEVKSKRSSQATVIT